MKIKIKFRAQQRMTHQKLCRTHPENGSRMNRARIHEITGPGGSKTQKIGSQTTKSRKHGGIREKITPKSHKKHGPDVTKTPPDKNPLF